RECAGETQQRDGRGHARHGKLKHTLPGPPPNEMNAALKTTPFHTRTAALNAGHAWRRWAGYVAASSYELTHEREYHAIRGAAGLLDISPLYKYLVRGRDAARLLDCVV